MILAQQWSQVGSASHTRNTTWTGKTCDQQLTDSLAHWQSIEQHTTPQCASVLVDGAHSAQSIPKSYVRLKSAQLKRQPKKACKRKRRRRRKRKKRSNMNQTVNTMKCATFVGFVNKQAQLYSNVAWCECVERTKSSEKRMYLMWMNISSGIGVLATSPPYSHTVYGQCAHKVIQKHFTKPKFVIIFFLLFDPANRLNFPQ